MNLSVHRHKTLRVKNKFKKKGGEEGGRELKIVLQNLRIRTFYKDPV